MKCPPMPELQYRREPCHLCGAATEKEAATKCRPRSDETGERYCGADFDADGFAISATVESLAAMDTWIDVHHDCFETCTANQR